MVLRGDATTAVLVVMTAMVSSVLTWHLHYEELQELGASCPPRDSCQRGSPQEGPPTSCSCDRMCARHGSCCIDSPRLGSEEWKESCQTVRGTTTDMYMVSKCDSGWLRDTFLKSRCEAEFKDLRDPLSLAPVTSASSGVTYKNYFCALCNNDYLESAIWKIKFDVLGESTTLTEAQEEEILSRLEYNPRNDEWGYVQLSGRRRVQTIPLKVSFESPEDIKMQLNDNKCRSDLISDCADTWTSEETRAKCRSYMAAIYVQANDPYGTSNFYRNAHCAVCNYVYDFSNSTCVRYDTRIGAFGSPALSLSILLDVNTSDGKLVGQKSRCKEGKIYDPFFKKCRSLECGLPGFVVRNNRCVRA